MRKDSTYPCELSVVVPLYNETASLVALCQWIKKVLDAHGLSYEIILVSDGSTDGSWQQIEAIMRVNEQVRGIRFYKCHGKAIALREAFKMAVGRVIATMDADLQDSPDELPALFKMVIEEGYDLVSGWRVDRKDTWNRRFLSKIFNGVVSFFFKIPLHDVNCGLKAYRHEVAKNVSLYGEMHRYIVLDVMAKGFGRIGEKKVVHYARRYGKSKYGNPLRLLKCFLDILTATFVTRFHGRPMHFFGFFGLLFFVSGGGITLYLIVKKIYRYAHHLPLREVVDQPLFYLALVALVVGSQLFLTGFLAEILPFYATPPAVIQEQKGFAPKR